MNTVKLITEANDFSTSNYIIEEKDNGKKDYKKRQEPLTPQHI